MLICLANRKCRRAISRQHYAIIYLHRDDDAHLTTLTAFFGAAFLCTTAFFGAAFFTTFFAGLALFGAAFFGAALYLPVCIAVVTRMDSTFGSYRSMSSSVATCTIFSAALSIAFLSFLLSTFRRPIATPVRAEPIADFSAVSPPVSMMCLMMSSMNAIG